MPTDIQRLAAIKQQTLELIQQITQHPKPAYWVDGQRVYWDRYLNQLQATVSWCDEQLAGQQPCEIRSQGCT